MKAESRNIKSKKKKSKKDSDPEIG